MAEILWKGCIGWNLCRANSVGDRLSGRRTEALEERNPWNLSGVLGRDLQVQSDKGLEWREK